MPPLCTAEKCLSQACAASTLATDASMGFARAENFSECRGLASCPTAWSFLYESASCNLYICILLLLAPKSVRSAGHKKQDVKSGRRNPPRLDGMSRLFSRLSLHLYCRGHCACCTQWLYVDLPARAVGWLHGCPTREFALCRFVAALKSRSASSFAGRFLSSQLAVGTCVTVSQLGLAMRCGCSAPRRRGRRRAGGCTHLDLVSPPCLLVACQPRPTL